MISFSVGIGSDAHSRHRAKKSRPDQGRLKVLANFWGGGARTFRGGKMDRDRAPYNARYAHIAWAII